MFMLHVSTDIAISLQLAMMLARLSSGCSSSLLLRTMPKSQGNVSKTSISVADMIHKSTHLSPLRNHQIKIFDTSHVRDLAFNWAPADKQANVFYIRRRYLTIVSSTKHPAIPRRYPNASYK